MFKKLFSLIVVFSIVSLNATCVFADGNQAYLIRGKAFKGYQVNVDGKELSLKEFSKLVEEKSPRAYEQFMIFRKNSGASGLGAILGVWSVYHGFNRYNASVDIQDTKRIIRIQNEGMLFMILGGVLLATSSISKSTALENLNRVIKFFNEDTGRIQFTGNTVGDEYLFSLKTKISF